MTIQEFPASHPFRTASYREVDGFTVPYAGQTRMRLTITSGMADARIRIDPEATDLIAIDQGDGVAPRLRVSSSELRLSWPAGTIGSWLRSAFGGRHGDIEIVLHPAVEWTLQIRGGLSRFEADLSAGKLARIEISGGISEAHFELPATGGIVPIQISGGASDIGLHRPADTGVTIAVSGGICGLRLDHQAFGAIGGSARLASGPAEGAHYSVEVSGGVSGLHVAARS